MHPNLKGWARSAACATTNGDGLAALAIAIVILFFGLAVYVKRCHDRNKSGWWCLLLLIPIVGLVWLIIDLGILKSTEGPNQYGPDPLETAETPVPPPPQPTPEA